MKILITGGIGYIGSHTCIELLKANYELVVIDNLSNSKRDVVDKIVQIGEKDILFYEGDVQDKALLTQIFSENTIDVVIHFAGLKAIGESVQKPLAYYYNNLMATLVLCDVMKIFEVKRLIFSSSAAIYGSAHQVPLKEDFHKATTNPYGSTKLMIEQILEDLYISDTTWCIAILRYFNPIGAHESGLIGENPNGIPNNLLPYIAKVAMGELNSLNIFGNDYPTPDGTGIRDYIHVVDLAKGHIKAVERVLSTVGIDNYNLGTGKGYSVLEIVKAFEEVSGKKIPYHIMPRRDGDVAVCYADVQKAKELLGWRATKGVEEMCKDTWHYINDRNNHS